MAEVFNVVGVQQVRKGFYHTQMSNAMKLNKRRNRKELAMAMYLQCNKGAADKVKVLDGSENGLTVGRWSVYGRNHTGKLTVAPFYQGTANQPHRMLSFATPKDSTELIGVTIYHL